jgi:hypothetical protein
MTAPGYPPIRRLDPEMLRDVDARSLLISQLRIRLLRDGKLLRACRKNTNQYAELGDYFTVDAIENYVVDRHVDVEALALELGIFDEREI